MTQTPSSILTKIKKCNTIDDLHGLITEFDFKESLAKFEKKYPSRNFELTYSELNDYIRLDAGTSIGDKLNTPLEKLFYALIWKNGNLPGLNHIIKGLKKENFGKTGIIFNQYGKHLANPLKEPIVDQHVLRVFKESLNLHQKNDTSAIQAYKAWLSELSPQLQNKDGLFLIDKILFFKGKTMKVKKQKRTSTNSK